MTIERAIQAFVGEHGTYDAVRFKRFYCGSFDYECDVAEYLVEQFIDAHDISDYVACHLNRQSIYQHMLMFDYRVIEHGGEFHLFLCGIV